MSKGAAIGGAVCEPVPAGEPRPFMIRDSSLRLTTLVCRAEAPSPCGAGAMQFHPAAFHLGELLDETGARVPIAYYSTRHVEREGSAPAERVTCMADTLHVWRPAGAGAELLGILPTAIARQGCEGYALDVYLVGGALCIEESRTPSTPDSCALTGLSPACYRLVAGRLQEGEDYPSALGPPVAHPWEGELGPPSVPRAFERALGDARGALRRCFEASRRSVALRIQVRSGAASMTTSVPDLPDSDATCIQRALAAAPMPAGATVLKSIYFGPRSDSAR